MKYPKYRAPKFPPSAMKFPFIGPLVKADIGPLDKDWYDYAIFALEERQ
jgi:hypothetical protein